jgi:glycosyltransferase involved in cell wall biosynthesis
MNATDVTVLTVVHNGARYLEACLESVRNQTGLSWEHVVVDNGSTDETPSLLAVAQAADPRLRILRLPENTGPGGGLKAAVPHIRGRYVAIIDADDLMKPRRLERQAAVLDSDPALVAVYGHAEMISADGHSLGRRVFAAGSERALREFAKFWTPAVPSTMCVRASAYCEEILKMLFPFAEDYDFVCRLLERGRVGFLPEEVSAYRRHGAQTTQTRQLALAWYVSAIGLLAARRRAGRTEVPAELVPLTQGKAIKEAGSIGEVHAEFARLAAREGIAWLEVFHARRALRRGQVRALPHMIFPFILPRPHRGSWRKLWQLAWRGPLHVAGIKRD